MVTSFDFSLHDRRRSLLVERARARSQYPRPWGFEVDIANGAGDGEPAPESVEVAVTLP